jgi:hypothetical protein
VSVVGHCPDCSCEKVLFASEAQTLELHAVVIHISCFQVVEKSRQLGDVDGLSFVNACNTKAKVTIREIYV